VGEAGVYLKRCETNILHYKFTLNWFF